MKLTGRAAASKQDSLHVFKQYAKWRWSKSWLNKTIALNHGKMYRKYWLCGISQLSPLYLRSCVSVELVLGKFPRYFWIVCRRITCCLHESLFTLRGLYTLLRDSLILPQWTVWLSFYCVFLCWSLICVGEQFTGFHCRSIAHYA